MKLEKAVEWTETDDKILEAGIMKYGINKWSKVSSLLPSKSSSQCRFRWQQYVDPSLNNSAWDVEEDKRLVDTVKVFHPQWNLIGQAMGRHGQQCYERYNSLVFGKIDVFKYAELEKPKSGDGNEGDVLEMAKTRIMSCKNRKDIKKEKERILRQRKTKKNDD